jgi:coenzyme F420-0:L-glutamate ligase / coenzyme F420-1:gamma-L-glutamate ligase
VASLSASALAGLPELRSGDDLAALIATAASHAAAPLADGQLVVIAHKAVSKCEGAVVSLSGVQPSARARELAAEAEAATGEPRDPRAVQVVLDECSAIVRAERGVLICRTRHGFVCANAGVDLSNVADGTAALLPEDSDRSARRIRAGLKHLCGADVGVIVSDTFGRTWRRGVTDVAIGCAGVAAVIDLRGTTDANGRELMATELCVGDELASAAELVMGKDRGIPAAIVRGVPSAWLRTASVQREIVRPPDEDLFR